MSEYMIESLDKLSFILFMLWVLMPIALIPSITFEKKLVTLCIFVAWLICLTGWVFTPTSYSWGLL